MAQCINLIASTDRKLTFSVFDSDHHSKYKKWLYKIIEPGDSLPSHILSYNTHSTYTNRVLSSKYGTGFYVKDSFLFNFDDLLKIVAEVDSRVCDHEMYGIRKFNSLFDKSENEKFDPRVSFFGKIYVYSHAHACYNDGEWRKLSLPTPKFSQKELQYIIKNHSQLLYGY